MHQKLYPTPGIEPRTAVIIRPILAHVNVDLYSA